MGKFIAEKTIKKMIQAGKKIRDSKILMMGIAFKEDCPDIRNTWVIDIIKEFNDYGAIVDVYDPWVDPEEVEQEYQLQIVNNPFESGSKYDAIVVAVGHHQFKNITMSDYRSISSDEMVVIDVKGVVDKPTWRL